MSRVYPDMAEEPERPLSLIADHPGDTLARCADVMAFLANTVTEEDAIDGHPAAKQGFFWITRSVEDALRYTIPRIKTK